MVATSAEKRGSRLGLWLEQRWEKQTVVARAPMWEQPLVAMSAER